MSPARCRLSLRQTFCTQFPIFANSNVTLLARPLCHSSVISQDGVTSSRHTVGAKWIVSCKIYLWHCRAAADNIPYMSSRSRLQLGMQLQGVLEPAHVQQSICNYLW